jgi:ankyrin repeat protein
LLAGGADVNAADESGATPLHYAASNAFGSTVELLIAAGASCEVADGRDRTPADYASSDNRALLAAC